MKKTILTALMLTLICSLPVMAIEDENDLGFALKQTGTLNISRDGNTITLDTYDSRIETLWYKSEIPIEELTYTLTMKHGGSVRIIPIDGGKEFAMKTGDRVTFSLKEVCGIRIFSIGQYGIEVKMNEAYSKPILIQMSNPRVHPTTEFEGYFVR